MPIDFRPNELDTRCREETTYNMSIRHRKTGVIVAGSGDNKYALECQLLEKLRQKMKEEEDNAARETGT